MTNLCPVHPVKAISLERKLKRTWRLKVERGTTWYKALTKKSGELRPSGGREPEMTGEDKAASQKAVSR